MVNIYTALAFLALFLLIETKSLDASTERIAGGQRAILGQFLHQVSARRFGRHYCGGAIIGDRVVLTSASCLLRVVTGPPMNSSSTNVVAGTLTSSSPVQGTVYRVSRITNHPQFHLNSLANDISVIRTVDNIRFTNAVRAIGLPTANVADGAETTFSGWGQTRLGEGVSRSLQFLHNHILGNQACRRHIAQLGLGDRINGNTLCTRKPARAGNCAGDFGGPLINRNGNVVIGIASWSVLCGEEFPDVYTRVFSYLAFIRTAMNNNAASA